MNILICRLGALGDTLITTPLVGWLHSLGHKIFYLTSESGATILKENPKIEKVITHKKDSVPSEHLGDYFKAIAQREGCRHIIDLCESIEVNLALHPSDPRYKYPKYERRELCDKNYYDETIAIGRRQLAWGDESLPLSVNPEMYFSADEDYAMRKFFEPYKGRYTVLIGLSGSARQKTYPYISELIQALTKEIPNVQFITTGDESCQILEYAISQMENVLATSGLWGIRQSILACKYADLVISPDTGLLHGAGCFDTPKIGLLTATTIENITKHFENDLSVEAQVGCAPCFYLIYDADTQCNLGKNRACICMDKGIPVDLVVERALEAYYHQPKKKTLEVVGV